MSPEQYTRERLRLLKALKDATDRGDYYLEMDIREKLTDLQNKYYEGDEE